MKTFCAFCRKFSLHRNSFFYREGPTEKAECVIINGVECEPYITSDYRLMMEKPDEVIEGVKLIMKAVGVNKAYIGIETNKPHAIDLMIQKLMHMFYHLRRN